MEAVTDDEIREAYKLVARLEGVFCEPASAASIAGLTKLAARGEIEDGQSVVCVLTGNGLKDPNSAMASSTIDLEPIEPTLDAVRRAMGL